jgi:hypothetical protein
MVLMVVQLLLDRRLRIDGGAALLVRAVACRVGRQNRVATGTLYDTIGQNDP